MTVYEFTKIGLILFSTFMLASGGVLALVIYFFGQDLKENKKATYEKSC